MKTMKFVLLFALLMAIIIPLGMAAAKGPPTGGETVGNNLSYPVIWAEGVKKTLREPPSTDPYYLIKGEWWYWWGTTGTDPNIEPLSCAPDPDDIKLCDDGVADAANGDPPGAGFVKAYLQKDEMNVWQAGTADWKAKPVAVDWIDWGDNLESVDWYTRSQVRTEVVLFKDLDTPMLEYEMRHTDGWGITEVHGLAATPGEPDVPIEGPGTRATVYSPCARLTIQKLRVERDDAALTDLVWVTEEGWIGDGLINEPIFNLAVHEGADGPGYYSAEINVKGRIIYGYTWNVQKLNEGAGDYRITFSFDKTCPTTVPLNTFFVDNVTEIMVPLEEIAETQTLAEEPGSGATAVLDTNLNLTYIDVRILERTGGGGGGGGGGSRGGGGGGGGRHP